MKKIILILSILVLSIGLLYLICDLHHVASAQHEGHKPEGDGLASDSQSHQRQSQVKETAPNKALYHCPMHPSYISDKPGNCPICGMKLVPIEQESEQKQGEVKKKIIYRSSMNPNEVSDKPGKDSMGMEMIPVETEETSESKVEGLASIKVSAEKQQLIGVTTAAAKKQSLTKTIRTVGRIAFDPELYKAEEEFIQALKSYNQLKESPLKESQESAQSLVESSKLKLKLMGLGEEQIKELENKSQADTNLLIAQEDKNIWLYATIYESDLDLVKIGQNIEATTTAYPGEIFKGKIASLDAVFNAQTRSVKARALVENPRGKLKPDMYADVEIKIDLGENLVIPESAVLDSGTRQIVFVDMGNGYFEPREVKIGQRSDDWVIVLGGIKEGENVVSSGNFLVDSESKLKSAIGAVGHQHSQ